MATFLTKSEIIPFLLTGEADQTAIAKAKQNANLHACLYKPWTETELSKVIFPEFWGILF